MESEEMQETEQIKSIYSRLKELIQIGRDLGPIRDLCDYKPEDMSYAQYNRELSEGGVTMRAAQSEIKKIQSDLSSLSGPLPLALYALAGNIYFTVSLSSQAYRDYEGRVKHSLGTVDGLMDYG